MLFTFRFFLSLLTSYFFVSYSISLFFITRYKNLWISTLRFRNVTVNDSDIIQYFHYVDIICDKKLRNDNIIIVATLLKLYRILEETRNI